MRSVLIVLAVIVMVPLFLGMYGCAVYNDMAAKQVAVDAAWSDVNVQYQRRSDLIPNVLATVKAEAKFEQDTLKAVIEARASVGQVKFDANDLAKLTPEQMDQFEKAQQGLSGALQKLLVVSERYPDLKANAAFRDLRTELEGTENRVGVARHRFVDATKEYNASLVGQPRAMIAGWGNFKPRPFYEAKPGSEEAPKIDFGDGVKK